MGRPAFDIASLTPDERLELIGELWNSLEPSDIVLTPVQREELGKRLDRIDAEGPTGAPWSEVESRVRSRSR